MKEQNQSSNPYTFTLNMENVYTFQFKKINVTKSQFKKKKKSNKIRNGGLKSGSPLPFKCAQLTVPQVIKPESENHSQYS